MRATFLVLSILLCSTLVYGDTFIFKSGKSIQGTIRYEDSKTILIVEASGLEMRLRKSELNMPATAAANATPVIVNPIQETAAVNVLSPKPVATKRVFTNRDVRGGANSSFSPPVPETKQAWEKMITRLEVEFVRLQGACRGAGTGPNLTRIRRSHTYNVQGKQVHVTGYWADPANINQAKQICGRAIETEETLAKARRGYGEFLVRNKESLTITGR
jgi:hypothetical protein